MPAFAPPVTRVDWVDYAKGFCIVMVVMMHSTLGVEAAAGHDGWMHALVAFARPFRMPDFFMISGLFLANVIDRDWRTYADRKVVHFAYFYLLWMTIQLALKAHGMAAEAGWAEAVRQYALAFIDPFGTLWFIYLLPIFFVTIKIARSLRIPSWLVWLAAAALEIAHVQTGWMVPDEFAARFVYIYTGYLFAPQLFAWTRMVQARPTLALGGLMLWAVLNGTLVWFGLAGLPFVSLGLGLIGAAAVMTVAALMAKSDLFRPLRYCGRNSIVIYLAFFLFMAASRTLLLRTGIVPDLGTVSVIVTACGVIGSLMLFWAMRSTPLRWLFERPAMFRLKPQPRLTLQPAE
jgi:uncharacterized membrane protein YcfT